jgi:hypothetical protein
MRYITIVLLIMLASVGMFMAGYEYHQPREVIVDRWHKSETIEVVKEIEVPVEIVKEITIPVYIYEPVSVVKEVPAVLSDWGTLEELEAFLAEDNTNNHIYLTAGGDGVVQLKGQCEDAAIQLMDNAAIAGKRLSFVPLAPSEYKKWYGVYPGANAYHVICGALVGSNEFYYIEPSTDKIWLAQYLDEER